MEDIAPKLIQLVTDEFRREYETSNRIQNLLEKVKQKTATYAEAQEYAIEVSRLIGSAYEKHISSAVLPDGKMYYNIASRLIPSSLDENYKLVSQYAADVQTALNKKANIGLKTQVAELDQDRVDGLVELASNAEQYDDVSKQLQSAYENFSQHIVDETIRKNAEFHYNAGMKPKIIRKAESKCCKWCRALAGEFNYPDVPDDIYRRHENCRCTVEYDPADGKGTRQNVYTKKWTEPKTGGKIGTEEASGAASGAKKTPGWEKRHADRYYEEIRNRAPYSDAEKIAGYVTDLTAEQIEDIRQHLFIREQPRSDGHFRFDSDYDIAQAWQRLVSGKDLHPSDRILLMHEYEELTIMRNTGCSYEEAHEKANKRYNWWEEFLKEGG